MAGTVRSALREQGGQAYVFGQDATAIAARTSRKMDQSPGVLLLLA
jgi:hypothetical protein